MSGIRRRARIAALQALYEIDSTGHPLEEVLPRLQAEEGLSEKSVDFASVLAYGVMERSKELDEKIRLFAPAFPVAQMSGIDRNILRIAIFELLFNNDVPVRAVINEAVELAKMFGSEASYKFVNGVLGAVVLAKTPEEGKS